MQESKTPFTGKESKSNYPPIKKSTSLYEARQKHKNDRAKNDKFRNADNFDEFKEGSDLDTAKVPRLIPTKSSPVNERGYRGDDDLMHSIPSYRENEHFKPKHEAFDLADNWEVSRIENNSEFERSFKKEVRNILPTEERKSTMSESERRLDGLDFEDEVATSRKSKNKDSRHKTSTSPLSDDK